jgi:Uma2 family endonuclease
MAIADPRPPVETAPRPFTAADLAELPRELPSGPVHFELGNGRLVAHQAPDALHGSVLARLCSLLLGNDDHDQPGEAYTGGVGIVPWRNPDRVVGADIAFIRRESLPVKESREGYLETIPDLVVEVASKNDSAAYLERKAGDYLRAGVRVVWVADPQTKTVTEHRRDVQPCVFGETETVALPEIIPGLQLTLKDVFRS